MARMKLAALALGLAAGLSLSASAAADCLKDRSGEVICGGGQCLGSVLRTINGETLCGKGRCVVTLNGEVICSAVDGGAAMKQSDGSVRCQGGCEYASLDLCERTSAGW